ncbi:MAG TPA: N-acetyl-gamma-glutamyl-phosphate reductase [Bacteroidia bacterium]
MRKVKVAVVGASGYTGGELLRLLLHHPGVELKSAIARSDNGRTVSEIFPDLLGQTELVFTDTFDNRVDHVFLCLGHGESSAWLEQNKPLTKTTVIDLSDEFRYRSDEWVYGLPEMNENLIAGSKKVANPGCFASAIQYGLLPVMKFSEIPKEVHIQAITGSTGAGKTPGKSTHFSERSNNLSVYEVFTHRHLHEIKHSLKTQSNADLPFIGFVPLRGPFSRGIMANITFRTEMNQEEIQHEFKTYYSSAKFVRVLKSDPDLKTVLNTNYCNISIQVRNGLCLITSVIDNLIKGASGQAIQNFNLMYGFSQDTSLQLKSSVY